MLVLAVLLVASHKLKGVFRVNSIESASIDESCDLGKDVCTSILPKGGKVHFSITPKDIKTSSSLSFQVKVEGVETSSVEVDLISLNKGISLDGFENFFHGFEACSVLGSGAIFK